PNDPEIWLHLAVSLWRFGNKKESLETLRKLVKLRPEDQRVKKALKEAEEDYKKDEWYFQGNTNLRLKDFQKALDCFEKAIEIDPQFKEAWNDMSSAYKGLENYQKAIECCEKAIEIDPKHINSWFNMGIAYLEKSNIANRQKAIECFKKVIEIDPQDQEARNILKTIQEKIIDPQSKEEWYNQGKTNLGLKNYQKALDCFEKAIKIDPEDKEVWLSFGVAYYHMNNYQKSIECYEKAIQIDPKFHKALFNLGNTYGLLKNYQKSIEYHEKVVEIKPKLKDAWFNMGHSYHKLGESDIKNYPKAIECFEKVIEIDPQDKIAEYYFHLSSQTYKVEKRFYETPEKYKANNLLFEGNDFINQGKFQKAFQCFEECVKLDSEYLPTVIQILKKYIETNPNDLKARKLLNEMNKTYKVERHSSPENAKVRDLLLEGNNFMTQWKYRNAIQCFEEAIKLNSELLPAWFYMGVAYGSLSNLRKARECYEKVVSIKNVNLEHPLILLIIGIAYNKLKQPSKAIKFFEKRLLYPTPDDAMYNLAHSYRMLGNNSKAIEILKKLLKRNPNYSRAKDLMSYLKLGR
ncbi:MAG: tetratricopeptide repeat protein, partial [Candidatus Hodarchaeota archaeon]